MTSDKRVRLEAVVRALLAKSVANGATEAEAMSAAAKAKELIDRYQIELTTAEVVAEGCEQVIVAPANSYERSAMLCMAMKVSEFCEVRVYCHDKSFALVGLKSDVAFAGWLLASLAQFSVSGAVSYVAGSGLKGGASARAKNDFTKNCAVRISQRLGEMIRARKVAATGSRNALVPVKAGMINQWFKDSGLRLRSRGSVTKYRGGSGAAQAGNAYGNKASFGRPVGGNVAGYISAK